MTGNPVSDGTFPRVVAASAPSVPCFLPGFLTNERRSTRAGLAERTFLVHAGREKIDALSERYRYMRHAVVVGRGLNYANAFELSLKLMETCYVVTERFSSADFMHG